MSGLEGRTEAGALGGAGQRARDRDRLAEARRRLDEAGIRAPVRAAGIDGEIAAVTGPAALRKRLAAVGPALRRAGFQYVALELDNQRGTDIQDI